MYEISVIGLGFVGLPLLISISDKKKFLKKITGIEINNKIGEKKIKDIKNSKNNSLFLDNKLNKIFSKNKKDINFSINYNNASNSDFIFFCFPLHITKKLTTNFDDYCNLIGKYFKIAKSGAIFIFNSTSPPGITSQIIKELRKKNLIRDDVFFVFSPERVMPGIKYYDSIVNSHRVFSSNSNLKISKKVKKLFSIIFNTKKFEVTEFKKYEEAECTKILENSYRAINIALIEEWTILAEKFGIDLFSVIKAIKNRDTHSNIMKPGLGVGGYCLTKDPYFAKFTSNKFLNNKLNFPFVDLTMKINSKMHIRVTKEINKIIQKDHKINKILIAGISYAENVDDIRSSRSLDMIKNLYKKGKKLTIYDPVVKPLSYKKIEIIKNSNNLKKYDLIIFNVKHKQFDNINFIKLNNNVNIIDTNNVLNENQIKIILKKKINLKIIGRGDI
jgi:UDP-N-acetyl-D-glucosamine dehydrogenase